MIADIVVISSLVRVNRTRMRLLEHFARGLLVGEAQAWPRPILPHKSV